MWKSFKEVVALLKVSFAIVLISNVVAIPAFTISWVFELGAFVGLWLTFLFAAGTYLFISADRT